MNRDLASHTFSRRYDLIDDREQRIGWTSCDHCRLAHRSAGLDEQIQCVVVDRQRRDFGAVVPRQIFPVPTGTVLWSNKVTFVADDIALDALYSRGDDTRGEIVDAFEVIAVVETSGD